MQQRALAEDDNDTDAAAGKWEFPGGHLEEDEEPLEGAVREFREETGVKVPEGKLAGHWTSGNGVYRLFVVTVPHEADVPINLESRHRIPNPDDPDGDNLEIAAWWAPEDAAANPALRDEAKATPWDKIAQSAAAARE
jgi:8-oxo-dGTP pyrophosphatase MutT (NUDIX family)